MKYYGYFSESCVSNSYKRPRRLIYGCSNSLNGMFLMNQCPHARFRVNNFFTWEWYVLRERIIFVGWKKSLLKRSFWVKFSCQSSYMCIYMRTLLIVRCYLYLCIIYSINENSSLLHYYILTIPPFHDARYWSTLITRLLSI